MGAVVDVDTKKRSHERNNGVLEISQQQEVTECSACDEGTC